MSDLTFPALRALQPLSAEERAESLLQFRTAAGVTAPVRVFAYGSLMWDPCFVFDEAETAVLDGFHRAFNFWSVVTRGTPERPGLGLGLEPGGSCNGVLFRLSDPSLDAGLEALWAREMYTTVYEPRRLRVRTASATRHAIGFVTNAAHEQYAGGLSTEAAARIIAGAVGENGPCRDYLASIVGALARHGIDDPDLVALLAVVDRHPPA